MVPLRLGPASNLVYCGRLYSRCVSDSEAIYVEFNLIDVVFCVQDVSTPQEHKEPGEGDLFVVF